MSGFNSEHLATGSKCPELNPAKITIFNMRYCPYAQRAMLVALAKNLDFDTVNINLSKKPDWHIEKHPMTQVPALQQGEFIIFESLVVAEYLDDKYPQVKLGPETPEQRAKDAGLVAMYASKFVPHLYKMIRVEEGPEKEATIKAFHEGLDYMENELRLRGSPFFGGAKVGLVDFNIWPWIERIPGLQLLLKDAFVDWKRFPLLTAWIEKMEADPTVKKYRVPNEIHTKFYELYLSGNIRYDLME